MIHETPCGQLWPCHALGEEGQGFDPPPRWWGAPLSATRRPVGGYCSMKFSKILQKITA